VSIANYTDLQSAVADFLNRDDLTSVIPTFIAMAEANLNRSVRHWRMEDRATALLDTQYSALPTNYLEIIRASLLDGNTHILEQAGAHDIAKMRAEGIDQAGRPKYFAIVENSIEVYPTPDQDYTIEIVYYEQLPDLATNSTNWLLNTYPDAYLYGALVHSAPYLGEDARAQTWASLFQAAVSAINTDGDRAKNSGSSRNMRLRSF